MYHYVIHNKLMRFFNKRSIRASQKGNLIPELRPQRFKIGIITLVIVSLFLLNLSPFSKGIKNFFYLLSEPVQKWLWGAGDNMSDFFEAILGAQKLEEENKALGLKNQELISQDIELAELRKENEVLRMALGLGLEKEFALEIADVIGKELSKDYLMINKGSVDGIVFGLPVITQQKSLVGKIAEVYENVSKVQLLTSKDSSVDVEIFEKEIYGLTEGGGGIKLYLRRIPQEKQVKTRDKIITAALGGNFPRGLLVGEVQDVKRSDITPFQEAEVKPAFDIKELNYVFIITNFNL